MLKNIHIGMRLEGLYRKDVPEIATEAMREAIINAFCHRDYRDPDYVQVAIYKNRVEIRNPGTLFGGLTIADLKRGHVSRRRNPLIAELFRRIEMVEAWGRGMPLIFENAPDVVFQETAGLFIAEFGRPSFQSRFQEEHSPVKKVKSAGQGSQKMSVKRSEKSLETAPQTAPKTAPKSTRDHIIQLLRENPSLTKQDLMGKLQKASGTIKEHIRILQREGAIKRVGPAKGGHWEVINNEDRSGLILL